MNELQKRLDRLKAEMRPAHLPDDQDPVKATNGLEVDNKYREKYF